MTVVARGLDRQSLPMRLWRQASLRAWSPAALDFDGDRREWLLQPDPVRERVRLICSLFHIGERAVTTQLLPLLRVVADEHRIEEEMFLASFLCDETRHFDLFDRFFAVVDDEENPRRHAFGLYQRIVEGELEAALARLDHDRSPEAQVGAVATYHMVVEGIMAETGGYALRRILASRRILPGLQLGLSLVGRDESRHIAFGVYFLRRLIGEHGDRAYGALLSRLSALKPLVEASTDEFVRRIDLDDDCHISREELVRYSQQRFSRRIRRIANARRNAR